MRTRNTKLKSINNWQANRVALFIVLIGLLFLRTNWPVNGQVGEEGWTTPVNLSQSGTGTEPFVVVDDSGQFHVVWRDLLEDSFIYTTGADSQWSQPLLVEVPFGSRSYFPALGDNEATPLFTPQLVTDDAGLIHAFWLGAESELVHSSVPRESFEDFPSWTEPVLLGRDVVKFEVLFGENGRLHLAYVTNMESTSEAAGLYYRRTDNNGAVWSEASQLYQSPYFRLLTRENANLDISQNGQDLYISWDNQPRERVFLVHSQNGGTIWGTPEEIDRRQEEDNSDDVSPHNLLVASINGTLHLTWQAGHEGSICSQIHQWSTDEGDSWESSGSFLEPVQNCPDNVQFLMGSDSLLLSAGTSEAKYLLVWSGGTWYDPQLQPELTTFTDEDVFRSVNITCGQTVGVNNDQLFAISCGEGSGQDIWLTSRSVSSLVERLASTPLWNRPEPVAGESDALSSPSLLADGDNSLHAFWTQVDELEGGTAIYHSLWNGSNWSGSTKILTSPNDEAVQPSMAFSPSGNILAVWSNGAVGELYFSRVGAGQAFLPTAWSDPISLPTIRPAASDPSILIDKNGIFHVVYAITLNENRGIYTVVSEDMGTTWSEPTRIFDAVAAGWEMVDQPKLSMMEDGSQHLLFLRNSLAGGNGDSTSLYYSNFQGEGADWSDPEQVGSSSLGSASIVWHQIVGQGDRLVHRSWQEQVDGRTRLWHQLSIDNGLTWNSDPVRLDEAGYPGSAQLIVDLSGQAYIVSVQTDVNNNGIDYGVLKQWGWLENGWQIEETLELPQLPVLRANNLAVAGTGDGRLVAIYAGQSGNEELPETLLFTSRAIAIVEGVPTPLPTLTPTPEPTETPISTPTPEPTPSVVFPVDGGGGAPSIPVLGSLSGNNIIIVGAILAMIPVGLVIVLVLFRRTRSNRY